MASFYQINGRCTAFIAQKLKEIGYKNILHVSSNNGIDDRRDQLFIVMKDGSKKELKLVDYE